MVYNAQNYWVFGPCPSSGILEIIKHNVSETGSVSILSDEGRHLFSWIRKEELTSMHGTRIERDFYTCACFITICIACCPVMYLRVSLVSSD
jgi:hypothetical protein